PRPRRALHSFPTRRSSDLIPGLTLTAGGTLQAGADEVVVGASAEGFAKRLTEWVDSLTRTGGLISTRNEEMGNVTKSINEQIDRDRKSTRLNSSHVKISYA